MANSDFYQIQKKIISCTQCPRLIKYCKNIGIEKRASFLNENYWAKPVPSFSSTKPNEIQVLIVGLAPAAHGANRTGRMFTGDRSGEWLYEALNRYGFANQSESIAKNDGLKLMNCAITAVVHCAPPENKPNKDEIQNCSHYLMAEIEALKQLKCVIILGKIAYDQTLKILTELKYVDAKFKKPKFSHGLMIQVDPDLTLFTSFHPSQQNTFTGKLTRPMFHSVFENVQSVLHA